MTTAQLAIANYYQSIIDLEKANVITRHHGDTLSSDMMAEVGDAEDYGSEKSYVVDFIIATACGEAPEGINIDLFNEAAELMRNSNGECDDFADVYEYLVKNGYGVDKMFDCPVTEDTVLAYAAYMCYAI